MKQKLLFFLLGFYFSNSLAAALMWQPLAPGLEYTHLSTIPGLPSKGIHAFRIDLNKYQLSLAFTQNENQIVSVSQVMDANNAVIGVNGGFFTPDFKPLGLRINNGEIKNPQKNITWWGVFYTQGQQAYIVTPKNFTANKNINFAIQSGPRLIINGQIPSLKPGMANRSALGITQDGKIILLVTNDYPLSTMELAEIMQAKPNEGGFNCVNAINLDGGSSTQLYAQVNGFTLSIPSFALVADTVLVVPIKQ